LTEAVTRAITCAFSSSVSGSSGGHVSACANTPRPASAALNALSAPAVKPIRPRSATSDGHQCRQPFLFGPYDIDEVRSRIR
jgi:hypothetical protein